MNPALAQLEFLAGDWRMELSNASFLPPETPVARDSVAFEWIEDGAFLVMYMGGKPRGTPNATWVISRDDAMPTYTVLYYDARSVSRVYQMSFADGRWKMWRDAPGFSQRFEGQVSADAQTIIAHWEKSFDGSQWEHDFDVTYTKIS